MDSISNDTYSGNMKVFFKRGFIVLGLAVLAYAGALMYPNWAFTYSHTYKNFSVFSDRPIDSIIEDRLDEALTHLERSELYDPHMRFNIYFCYNKYRLGFFTRNSKVGGMVNGLVSQNVFLREADIAGNKIIPPGKWLMDAEVRTLTYFLTHELTHSLQAKANRFMRITHPTYIMEGYADYIAKKDSFNYEDALEQYRAGHAFYADDSPLYNRQHLAIAHLMDQDSFTYKDILANKPDLPAVLKSLQ